LTEQDPQTLGALLTRSATAAQGREALATPRRRLTYSELERESALLAGGLLSIGVQPGDALALLAENEAESYVAFFAATRIGVTFAPLQTKWKPREHEFAIKLSGATAMLILETHPSLRYWDKLAAAVPGILDGPVADPGVKLRNLVSLADDARAGYSYDKLLELGASHQAQDARARAEAAVRPNDRAILQFTSGTTAFPKGALLSHGGTVRMGLSLGANFGLTPDDRYFSCSPITHLGGTTFSLVTTFGRYATYSTLPRFDARRALEWMVAEGCTVQHGIDTHWLLEMQEMERGAARPSLRIINVAGLPPVPERVYNAFKPDVVMTGYGSTETGGAPVKTHYTDPLEKALTSSGRPLPGISMSIVDRETDADLPVGAEGEIRLKGWSQFLGYLNQPEATAAQLDEQGRSKTGDFGYVDPDGYLHFLGRIKRMFRTGGENYAPEEVEAILQSHPAITRAVLVPVADPVSVQVGHVYLVATSEDVHPSEAELQAFCLERLASYKVPRRFEYVAEADIPMTESGKVQRIALS
jgi:fatty-acyl-CoA synthase